MGASQKIDYQTVYLRIIQTVDEYEIQLMKIKNPESQIGDSWFLNCRISVFLKPEAKFRYRTEGLTLKINVLGKNYFPLNSFLRCTRIYFLNDFTDFELSAASPSHMFLPDVPTASGNTTPPFALPI